MKILFIHQHFPAQFVHLAPALARQGHDVTALRLSNKPSALWHGVLVLHYQVARSTAKDVHPWVSDFETKVIRAEACFHAALALKAQGYTPDLVIAHPGWGESLFIKEVWPQTRLAIYCEFFYGPDGKDVGFDPEFSQNDPGSLCRLRLKNLNNFAHFETADAGISPTQWQASTFPASFRKRISVIHDGIDTQKLLVPDDNVRLKMQTRKDASIVLSRQDEVLTFVNRNLEPHRGYHSFMRALPKLLRSRPHLQVLIVGGDSVSYGPKPDAKRYGERSWKRIFIDEVRPQIADEAWSRVHFLGNIPYGRVAELLKISRVHVYLTYPFVLSWSLLEAMSVGCAIVGSDTTPMREVIEDDKSGRLVDFFDVAGLAHAVSSLLEDGERRHRYGVEARAFAQARYDLHKVCLPAQLAWVQSLMA